MHWDEVDPEDSPWEDDEREERARYKIRIQMNAEELVGGTPFAAPHWVSPLMVPTYKELGHRWWMEVWIDYTKLLRGGLIMIYAQADTFGRKAADNLEESFMTSPPSLKFLSILALGPKDADVLSGKNWRMRQLLQAEERSTLVKGEPSVLVSNDFYFNARITILYTFTG